MRISHKPTKRQNQEFLNRPLDTFAGDAVRDNNTDDDDDHHDDNNGDDEQKKTNRQTSGHLELYKQDTEQQFRISKKIGFHEFLPPAQRGRYIDVNDLPDIRIRSFTADVRQK